MLLEKQREINLSWIIWVSKSSEKVTNKFNFFSYFLKEYFTWKK
jgi:hypothetical protein